LHNTIQEEKDKYDKILTMNADKKKMVTLEKKLHELIEERQSVKIISIFIHFL
jgi:hypothetical protein